MGEFSDPGTHLDNSEALRENLKLYVHEKCFERQRRFQTTEFGGMLP